MAIPAYMWITDDQGSQIKSSSTVTGRVGTAEIIAVSHNITIPSDQDTGALTGTRKHEPYIVTKQFCPATPVFNNACCSGTTLKQIKISWYNINSSGQEQEYFRHTLSNVKVVSVHPFMENIKNKNNQHMGHLEKVAFRYETIQWLYLDGNIASQDSWNARG